jgi:hypothetical protein
MPQLQFSAIELEKIKEGNFDEAQGKINKALERGEKIKFSDLSKLSLSNKENLEHYKFSIKNEFPKNSKVAFAVGQVEAEKQADILAEVANEALLRDNSLLARLNIREQSSQVPYIRMREFNEEKDAEVLTATGAGTEADEELRIGDKLMAETDSNVSKVQASTSINEVSEFFLSGLSVLDYQRKLVDRVANKVINQVLFAGQGVANGTARASGQTRGIVNNYGVNGTGDAANYIGAIEYANKSAIDTALGVTTSNPYDTLFQAKSILIPKNLSEIEESMYVLVMNRKTWGKIKTAKDLNGRYLAHSAIDPVTGKAIPFLDGTPVVTHTSIPDDKVFFIPAEKYTLFMLGGIRSLNDNGLVQLKEGKTIFVSRTYIDGSMEYGHKYKSGTAATIGTTAVDNQEQNAFRYFGIV